VQIFLAAVFWVLAFLDIGFVYGRCSLPRSAVMSYPGDAAVRETYRPARERSTDRSRERQGRGKPAVYRKSLAVHVRRRGAGEKQRHGRG
jgi:hypothetical protein